MIKLMKKLTAKDRFFIFVVAVLVVIQVWLDLTMPDYTERLTAAVSSGELVMSEIRSNGLKMLLCALGSMGAAILCGLFSSLIAASFAKNLRDGLFDHVLDFSNREINRFGTPSLITRTTNDIVQMQMVAAMGLPIVIKAPILAVWAIYKISSTGMEWTLAVFVCVLVMGLTAGSLVLVAYPRFKIIQKLTDKLNKVTRENISGVRVVRAFNAEDYQQEKFERVNKDITDNHLFTARILGLMMPIMTTCLSGLSMAIYWIGAYLINAAPVTERAVLVGEMTAFTQYAIQVVAAFIMLVAIFVILPRVLVSAKRISDVLYADIAITYNENDAPMTDRGKIEFKDVTFAFNSTGSPCLKNISFYFF